MIRSRDSQTDVITSREREFQEAARKITLSQPKQQNGFVEGSDGARLKGTLIIAFSLRGYHYATRTDESGSSRHVYQLWHAHSCPAPHHTTIREYQMEYRSFRWKTESIDGINEDGLAKKCSTAFFVGARWVGRDFN